MGVRDLVVDFSDMSGGKNSAFPAHAINDNQVADTKNLIHEAIGLSRAPGYTGIKSTAAVSAVATGMFKYLHDDGTETLITVSNGKVYSVNVTTGALTEIGTMTGTGECWAVNAVGKLWMCNGTSFVKVEDDLSVYRVQIATPTTGTASAQSGGTLADGVYGVYVSYARYDSATGQYLYSLPKSLGDVTLGSGNNTVRVSLTESSDGQVNRVVVFMTDAGGAVPYYYAEVATPTGTTPTATIDVSSTATRNSDIKMAVVSAANQLLPVTPAGIYSFNDRLFVWASGGKTVYWSQKTDVNVFDIERFFSEYFRDMPYVIDSVFSVGSDLFFNHVGSGIRVAYSGDMASEIKHPFKKEWFIPVKTPQGKSYIEFHKGLAIGWTNDGMRIFDGGSFSDDLSFHIKPDVDRLYSGTSKLPSAIIHRRGGKRTEFRTSYKNNEVSTTNQNSQLVFNVDYYFDPMSSKRTWEYWETGFSYMAILGSTWYGLQNSTSDAQIVRESGTADIYCYSRVNTYLSTKTPKRIYILTRTVIPGLKTISFWGSVYWYSTSSGTINGNILIYDEVNSKFSFETQNVIATEAVLPSAASGLGLALPFVMSAQYPINTCIPMPYDCRGNVVALELFQEEEDNSFFIYKLQLPRAKEVDNNMT